MSLHPLTIGGYFQQPPLRVVTGVIIPIAGKGPKPIIAGGFVQYEGGFNPLSLHPLIWLDPSQMSLADGASVSSETDFSGNGNSFTEATPVNQPIFKKSIINGLPSILGDGVASNLTSPALGVIDTFWGMFVFRPVTVPGTVSIWDLRLGHTGLWLVATPEIYVDAQGGNTGIAALPNTSYAAFFQFDGTTFTLQNNLNEAYSNVGGSALDGGPMSLFSRFGMDLYFNGYIAEILFGIGNLSVSQIASLWKYIGSKWGLTHP